MVSMCSAYFGVLKRGGDIMAVGRDLIDAVLPLYKQGASQRDVVDGVNRSDDSVALFREASRQWLSLSEDQRLSVLEQAEARHHAASSCAPGNGNCPDLQGTYNHEALIMLGAIPAQERTTKWQELRDKIAAGLMENGFIPFDEDQYRAIVDRQLAGGLKDAPGRAEFLITRLRNQGRNSEAKQFARRMRPHLVRKGTNFAPNQVKRLVSVVEATLEVEQSAPDTSVEGGDDSDPADPANPSTGPPAAPGSFAPAPESTFFI